MALPTLWAMGLFDQLFGSSAGPAAPDPPVRFGRYTDVSKAPARLAAWEQAQDAFAARDYPKAFEQLLVFLRDPAEDNVTWERDGTALRFELHQGSVLVAGRATEAHFSAVARIARSQRFPAYVLRPMLEKNYQLRYTRFALDDRDCLVLRFDSHAVDGMPRKLVEGLRELALQADKADDLLLEKHEELEAVDDTHLLPLSPHEKTVKYAFLQREIRRTLDILRQPAYQLREQPGGAAYLLLALCYKLDYLLKPEGGTMDVLERVHRIYQDENGRLPYPKLDTLRRAFEGLSGRDRDAFFREMYRVRSTFGVTAPLNHTAFVQALRGELDTLDWYANNQLSHIARAIPTYLVGHLLFRYALPAPDHDLLHLYFHITENAYFRELGFKQIYYDDATAQFRPKAIRRALQRLARHHRTLFPRFQLDHGGLNYADDIRFRQSYLRLVSAVDLGR